MVSSDVLSAAVVSAAAAVLSGTGKADSFVAAAADGDVTGAAGPDCFVIFVMPKIAPPSTAAAAMTAIASFAPERPVPAAAAAFAVPAALAVLAAAVPAAPEVRAGEESSSRTFCRTAAFGFSAA